MRLPLLILPAALAMLASCGAGIDDAERFCTDMQLGLQTEFTPVTIGSAPAVPVAQSEADALANTLRVRRAKSPGGVYNVALLSAGGQWGAFSAGFMSGWSQNSTDPRPENFDLVTGVSTGALMAPFVFAGPAYDPVLRDLYYGINEERIFRRRGPLELVRASSLWDVEPLEDLIDLYLTPDLISVLGAEAEERSLLVGTVNLESGFFEAFDITSMAASGSPETRDCISEGLLASSAIPVALPPRLIDGQLYVDGATRQAVFLDGLAEAGIRPRIHILINAAVGFPVDSPKPRLTSLVGRTSDIATDELLRQSAIEVLSLARERGWEVRGAVAPDIWPGRACDTPEGDVQLAFCRSFTRELFDAGYAMASDGPINWMNADALIEELRRQQTALQ